MSTTVTQTTTGELAALAAIERRVLWLAVRIVDYANRERPSGDPLKVGGHQASSASMVTLMTALWLADMDARDRVSVKPHASPVLQALEYLLGRLDRSYLTRLRDFGGLQSYPSRTKDPYPVDYSTGSVGLGSAAPLLGALADRYVATHFGASTGGRYISLLGDAELDEGNLWEAVAEPLTRGLGNALWIVDLNRQSLDRVIPGIRAAELESHFRSSGWDVIELKYGRKLREAYAREGGGLLRRRIDEMPNQAYQALFGASAEDVRGALLAPLEGADHDALARLLDETDDVGALVRDLGGHDLGDVLSALRRARETTDRPTVVFAYTIKGYGLEIAGRPQNHSALLTGEQIDRFRESVGLEPDTEWDGFAPGTPEGELIEAARRRLDRGERPPAASFPVPASLTERDPPAPISTQAAFGRVLLELSRVEDVGERLVTVSPDVAVSTNLGGFVNKAGVWAPAQEPVYDAMEDSPLKWRVGPTGQHIEMGIAEMNLVLLLGQLGLTWDYQRERLLPIGTVYDPFVMRALEGIVYSTYSGSRFVLVGTPSGISLSREGGAHQSISTPGIGIETPGLTYAEPCFARELEWLLLDALDRLQQPDGESLYLRLSTKPIDQAPFAALVEEAGADVVRAAVVAGGFRLREARPAAEDRVLLATCGAMVPEALAAAEALAGEEGVEATVLVLSSPDRLFHEWQQARTAPLRGAPRGTSHLERLVLEHERELPVVTVVDGSSHALSWLGSALGTRCVPLGVDRFGQTGSQPEVYAEYGIDPDSIVTAALVALEP